MKYTMSNFKLNMLLLVLLIGIAHNAYANAPKKQHTKRHAPTSPYVIQKTVINNYGLINNGVVQKTQQSSTAISNTQDNSLHQDNSTHQTLNQTQVNTLNQTQINTQVNALSQTQINGGSYAVATPAGGQPQSVSSLTWSTADGNQYLDASGSELRLKPRSEGTGPHTVTATSKLSILDTKYWQVSFDIRFGVLRDQASSFHIKREGRDIGWIGADGFSNQIGVFIGNDSEIDAFTADTQWHHLAFLNDGNSLTVGLDGKQIGSGASQNAPESLALLNNQDMTVPCHQEGVWMRNVEIQSRH